MERRKFVKDTLISSTGLMILPSLLRGFSLPPVSAVIDAKGKGKQFTPFWSHCVGAGRANEGLRASWLEQLQTVQKHCGFGYLRFHGLFHDDMFVYHEDNGRPVYNWQYIDDLFDRMLDIGVRPFVELGFMPYSLASDETAKQFWWKANVSPPKDYDKWANLVRAFVKHCISRYGSEEVRCWYFEVWNEPDLYGFWHGTKSQYFELYKVSANAIKAIDEKLRVGGPATSNFVPDDRFIGETVNKKNQKTLTVKNINTLKWHGVWIEQFLKYCHKEQLPVDFVSTHPYPTDWALDPMTGKGGGRVREVNATFKDLSWLKRTVERSAYPHAEIHCTEWSTSPSSRDKNHDELPAASFIIKANLDSIGLVNSLSYWTFTDVFEEKGAGNSIFHGGFGLINYQGIVKPAFHAYRMLHALGSEILQKEEGLIITRDPALERITALIYNYPKEMTEVVGGNFQEGKSRNVSLRLDNLNPGSSFVVETMDDDHGYGLKAWVQMGKPEPPDREQARQLKNAAWATRKEIITATMEGRLNWQSDVNPWSCILLKQV